MNDIQTQMNTSIQKKLVIAVLLVVIALISFAVYNKFQQTTLSGTDKTVTHMQAEFSPPPLGAYQDALSGSTTPAKSLATTSPSAEKILSGKKPIETPPPKNVDQSAWSEGKIILKTPDNFDSVIVEFKKGTSEATQNEVISRYGGQVLGNFKYIPYLKSILVPKSNRKGLSSDPDVTSVISDEPVKMIQAQTLSYGVSQVRTDTAWSKDIKGAGVRVAVIDSGIDMSNPDFAGAIDTTCSFNSYDRDHGAATIDNQTNGHGSHVAGIIAARDDGHGVVGVAPLATLCVIRVFDDVGNSTVSQLTWGIQKAVEAGVKIINISNGVASNKINDTVKTYLKYYVQVAVNNGATIIAAAGNPEDYPYLIYPAKFSLDIPGVIAVSTVDQNNTKPAIMGSPTFPDGPEITLVAPGTNILSDCPSGYALCTDKEKYPGEKIGILSGSSMSAPFVTGAVVLLLSQKISPTYGSSWTPALVKQVLIDSAKHLGTGASGTKNDQFGYGLLDINKMLELGAGIAPTYLCTGNVPSDSTLCSGSNTGLTQDVTVSLVSQCTAGNKCEYACKDGDCTPSATISASSPILYDTTATLTLTSKSSTVCDLAYYDSSNTLQQDQTIIPNVTVSKSTESLTNDRLYYFSCQSGSIQNQSPWVSANITVCKQGEVVVNNACATPSPDLTIVSPETVTITPSPVVVGQDETFSITVTNIGDDTISNFPNFFQIISQDQSYVFANNTDTVPSLAAKASVKVSGSYKFPSPGTYTVRFCANYTNMWNGRVETEINASNNCSDPITVTVAPPAPTLTVSLTNDLANPLLAKTYTAGDPALLYWQSQNTTSCYQSNDVSRSSLNSPFHYIGTAQNSDSGFGSENSYSARVSYTCDGTNGRSITKTVDLTWNKKSPPVNNFALNDRVKTTGVANIVGINTYPLPISKSQSAGSIGTIQRDQPYAADSKWWWAIKFDDGSAGFVADDSLTAFVPVVEPISVTLTASPASPLTLPANATRLTWTTAGSPDSCVASNFWSGTKTASGGFEDRTGMTAQTYNFVITCSKLGTADATASLSMVVNPAISATCSVTPSSGITGVTEFTWSADNVAGGTGSYTYGFSGTDGLTGTAPIVKKTYGTSGPKTASVTISSGASNSKTFVCNSASGSSVVVSDPNAVITVNPASYSVTLPNSTINASYTLTNGTSANTSCRLLDSARSPLSTTYASCTGSISVSAPSTASGGVYGYYIEAKKSDGQIAASNKFEVIVNPVTPTCANGGLSGADCPTGTWSYLSACPTACGTPASTQTQTCSSGNKYCSGTAATRTCTAAAACSYTVTPSAGTGGTISPNTAQTVGPGGTKTFTVSPNSDSVISSVTGCGGTLSGNTYATGKITADCTVSATFVPGVCTNGATDYANGCKTCVSGSAIIDGRCTPVTVGVSLTASQKTYNVLPGANISFAYTPTTNFGTTQCRLVNYDTSLELKTWQNSSPIAYTAENAVSGPYAYYIQCRNTDIQSIRAYSDKITINTACASGSDFISNSCQARPIISAAQAPHGTITPSGSTSVVYGSDKTYSITSDSGYSIGSLIIDGILKTVAGSYTFSNITDNHTISARFVERLDTARDFPNIFQISNYSDMRDTVAIIDAGTIKSLPVGSSFPITGSFTFNTPGKYYIRACANRNTDFDGSITESNTNNNCGAERELIISDPTMSATCSVSPATGTIKDSFVWTVSGVSGGNGSYDYTWNGTDGLSGSSSSIQKAYSTTGNKTGSITIRSDGKSETFTCNNSVNIAGCYGQGCAPPPDPECLYPYITQPAIGIPSQCCSTIPGVCPERPVASLWADPKKVKKGESSVLHWGSTNGATECTGYGFVAGGPSGERQTGVLDIVGIIPYQVECRGPGGLSDRASETIDVIAPNVTIMVDPPRVVTGGGGGSGGSSGTGGSSGRVTVSWNANNVDVCTVTKNGTIVWKTLTADASGSIIGSDIDTVSSKTTYSMSCTLGSGSTAVTAKSSVNVQAVYQEF
jgi:subtilisin family serine protease